MSIRVIRAVFGLSTALVWVACSNEPADRMSPGGALGPEERAACAAYAQGYCARHGECTGNDYSGLGGDEAGCQEAKALECEVFLAVPSTGFSAEWYQGCTSSLPAALCGVTGPLATRACTFPAGKLMAGEACSLYQQCESGWCSEFWECGTCAPRPKLLAPGALCEVADGPRCVDGYTCAVPYCQKEVFPGEACAGDDYCVGGLHCLGGTCKPGADVGAACGPTVGCASYATCEGGTCVGSPPPPPKAAGEPCSKGDYCTAGLYCHEASASDAGVCKPQPHEGESCDAQQTSMCFDDLQCVLGVCTRRRSPACP